MAASSRNDDKPTSVTEREASVRRRRPRQQPRAYAGKWNDEGWWRGSPAFVTLYIVHRDTYLTTKKRLEKRLFLPSSIAKHSFPLRKRNETFGNEKRTMRVEIENAR